MTGEIGRRRLRWRTRARACLSVMTVAAAWGLSAQGLAGAPDADASPVTMAFDPARWTLDWADEFVDGPAPDSRNPLPSRRFRRVTT